MSSGRKARGDAKRVSGVCRAPASPFAGDSSGRSGRRVLVWGVRSGATDALPRRQPRQGTEGGPLVSRQAHVLHSTAYFRAVSRGKNRSFFGLSERSISPWAGEAILKPERTDGFCFRREFCLRFSGVALSALFRRNSRGEVFAAVFKFLLGWAEFYRDSDRLIGLPGGLPVRTPFPRETYGYLFPFPLKGAGMRSRDIADGKFAFC